MAGRVKFPNWLYVRIDNPLRAALASAALSQGLTVSDLARRELRKALAPNSDQHTGTGRQA